MFGITKKTKPIFQISVNGNNNIYRLPQKNILLKITGNYNSIEINDNIQIDGFLFINISGNHNKIIIDKNVHITKVLEIIFHKDIQNSKIHIKTDAIFTQTKIHCFYNNSNLVLKKDFIT